MPVRIGKRRAAAAASDRGLNSNNSNDDPNRATDTDTVTFTKTATAGATAPLLPSQEAEVEPAPAAVVEAEEEENHPSNDDGCLPTPANVGSTLVTYEYNLSVMPGVDPLKAVTRVDEHMPVRIAQELGIWCDDDEAEDDEGMNRGRALAEGPEGIYKLTTGEPDVIRTDVQCNSIRFGFDCVAVKASLGVQYDADVTTADQASEHLRDYISNLMEHEIIRTKNSQASYVGAFGDRPAYGGVGGSGGVVSSTRGGNEAAGGGMTTAGKALLSSFSVLAVLVALLVLKKRRDNRRDLAENDDDALAPAPEKPLDVSRSGSDGTLTLDVDLDFGRSGSFDGGEAEVEAVLDAANILEDIERTVSMSSPANSPGRKASLPVVHEEHDPSFEVEV